MTNQVNECPLLIIMINEKEQKVENILDIKSHQDKLQYWIKWLGWEEDRKRYDVVRFEIFLKIA